MPGIASPLDAFSFGLRRKLPVILQTETAECGLACLAMVASHHGHSVDLATLRGRQKVSLKGMTLGALMNIAGQLKLAGRPLRLELEEIGKLRTPCILHWNMNHFVVLREVRGDMLVIHDPAHGVRKLRLKEASSQFTGVALELWPQEGFEKREDIQPVAIRQLLGRVTGLGRALVQIFALALALEIFGLVSPFFLQWVIDEAIVSEDRDLITTLALGFALLLVMQVLISTARSWIIMFFGTTLNVQWRANVFSHLLRLPLDYFQKRHLGDVSSRFASIDQIQQTLTTSFVATLLDGLMSVATLVMMFVYTPRLALIAVLTMILYAGVRIVAYRTLYSATNAQIVFAAKQSSYFLESVRGVKAIKLFEREDQRRTSWLALLVDQTNAGIKIQKLQISFGSLNAILVGAENILIIWLAANMVLDGYLTVGMLMAFKAYKDQFDGRVSGLIDKILQFRMLRIHGARLADIVHTPTENAPERSESAATGLESGEIIVRDLCFRYGDQEPMVLNGVNLHVRDGESVAIIGSSGCGKSTLMHVMLGLLEPVSGSLCVGGVEVRGSGARLLRSSVGAVTQDDMLLAGSIADNICFFDPASDRDWIEQCARMAAVHEEIMAMPMGYESLVGDMGSVLSGGQKQRVLLARALYRRPKILFLDEATSHLDLESENRVSNAIKNLRITRVIVAHRPETVASAERVVRLENGCTVDGHLRVSPRADTEQVTAGQSAALPRQPASSGGNADVQAGGDLPPRPDLPLAPEMMRSAPAARRI